MPYSTCLRHCLCWGGPSLLSLSAHHELYLLYCFQFHGNYPSIPFFSTILHLLFSLMQYVHLHSPSPFPSIIYLIYLSSTLTNPINLFYHSSCMAPSMIYPQSESFPVFLPPSIPVIPSSLCFPLIPPAWFVSSHSGLDSSQTKMAPVKD